MWSRPFIFLGSFENTSSKNALWQTARRKIFDTEWCGKRNDPIRSAYSCFPLCSLFCTWNDLAGYVLKCFTVMYTSSGFRNMPRFILFQSGRKKCQSNPKDKKSKLNRWQATFLVEGPSSNENVKQKRVLCWSYSTHFAGPANTSGIWPNSSSSFNIWKETYNQCTTCSEKETWN